MSNVKHAVFRDGKGFAKTTRKRQLKMFNLKTVAKRLGEINLLFRLLQNTIFFIFPSMITPKEKKVHQGPHRFQRKHPMKNI